MGQRSDESGHNPRGIVLDASAVLAVLIGEEGAGNVVPYLPAGCISTVNLAETLAVVVREGADVRTAVELVGRLSLAVIDFTHSHVRHVGAVQRYARSHNLSLGDCCCLGVAVSLGLPVLTGDRRWADLTLPVAVRVFR